MSGFGSVKMSIICPYENMRTRVSRNPQDLNPLLVYGLNFRELHDSLTGRFHQISVNP